MEPDSFAKQNRMRRIFYIVLLIIGVIFLISFAIFIFQKQIRSELIRHGIIIQTPIVRPMVKPAEFYYVTTELPTDKIPDVIPRGIVIDKNAQIQSITKMTATGKPTIYTIKYNSLLTAPEIQIQYLNYFNKNKMSLYNDANNKFDYVSNDPTTYKIKLDYSYKSTNESYTVTIMYIQYDTKN